ncbi:MAG TPA: T9SS type A sorting domain-containing protein, partial [Candidatus Eisenbacteria bacterium]|nr:T9SS type A sorting domain-containing protein [Candidatus Eisenbacteria bacterium]
HTISATFVAQTFTITSSAGPNGTITPLGATPVACNGSQTFTITPDPCYDILDVLVDNVSVGAVASYTFNNVTANHTISATFVQQTYTITSSAGAGGSIVPLGATPVPCNGSQAYTITPNVGFAIQDVLVDNVSVGPVANYTFSNVTANHTIHATFIETVPPVVTVIDPNGGETLLIGNVYPLDWTATDNVGVTCVDLYLSRTGPTGPWETIATCIPNSSPYNWTVTGPPTTQAIFRVVAYDAAGNNGEDKSDEVFTIEDFPTATVVATFRAAPLDEGVRVEWQINDTGLIQASEVERSLGATGTFETLVTPVTEENGVTVLIDRGVQPGQTYVYRLVGTTRDGQRVMMGTVEATAGIPIREFAIEHVGPNPTPGRLQIGFAIPRLAQIQLSMFDAQGREVAVLADGPFDTGRYSVTWSGEGSAGRLPSGLYFLRFRTPDRTVTRRIVLQR